MNDALVAVIWSAGIVAVALIARSMLREWIMAQEDARLGRPAAPRPPGARPALPLRPSEVALPDDLEAHVGQWQDIWARDDERAVVRAKYVELYTGDDRETWQRVRRAVGIGELP